MKIRETIDDLLIAKEGENYQFKEWKTKDDFKEATKICCALANCGGGKLILGVTDKHPRQTYRKHFQALRIGRAFRTRYELNL